MDLADKKATVVQDRALANDLYNLRAKVIASGARDVEPETKVWSFQGHLGTRVLVDRRDPMPFNTENPRFIASSWKIGERSTEINPVTGQHSYETGNLYRTVHWKEESFGLNGRFTDALCRAGPWRHEGLNCSRTRSKVLPAPSQWGTPKDAGSSL
eukprot:scaffold319684_cov44-Tisochrysis_lutea.AAC.2